MNHPCQQTYALRLHAPAHDPAALAGVLDHVLSGERRTFDSAAALIACLQTLQRGTSQVSTDC